MNRSYTHNLYAHPSFLEGFSRNLDIMNTLSVYNSYDTNEDADTAAIRSDWNTVGSDLKNAIDKYATK